MLSLHVLQPLVPALSALLAALLADMALRLAPQLRDRLAPLLGIPEGVASKLAAKLNRPERSVAVRAGRGVLTFLLVALVAVALALVARGLLAWEKSVEPLLWFLCLRVTFPWSACWAFLHPGKNDAKTGENVLSRHRVPVLVAQRSPDRAAVARMLVEAAATSLHRGLLAPVFWGLVAGLFHLPPVLVAIIVTVLLEAERAVTQGEGGGPFAQPFRVMETLVNFLPARIAAFFFVLGAFFTPGAHPGRAFRAMFVTSDGHRVVNAGWPVGAVAGALNIAIAGGRKGEWLGPQGASARVSDADVKRVLFLHAVTLGLTLLVLTALLFIAMAS